MQTPTSEPAVVQRAPSQSVSRPTGMARSPGRRVAERMCRASAQSRSAPEHHRRVSARALSRDGLPATARRRRHARLEVRSLREDDSCLRRKARCSRDERSARDGQRASSDWSARAASRCRRLRIDRLRTRAPRDVHRNRRVAGCPGRRGHNATPRRPGRRPAFPESSSGEARVTSCSTRRLAQRAPRVARGRKERDRHRAARARRARTPATRSRTLRQARSRWCAALPRGPPSACMR